MPRSARKARNDSPARSSSSPKPADLATSFIDQLGTYTEISDAALVAVLKALDVDASSDEAIVRSHDPT